MKMYFAIVYEYPGFIRETDYILSPAFESMAEFREAEWALEMGLDTNAIADGFEDWIEDCKDEGFTFEEVMETESFDVYISGCWINGKYYSENEFIFGIASELYFGDYNVECVEWSEDNDLYL